jgi:hypothetical protein
MYMVGMVLFLGFTLGCLFAPTIGVLVAFRGLQGLAGKGADALVARCAAALRALLFLPLLSASRCALGKQQGTRLQSDCRDQ